MAEKKSSTNNINKATTFADKIVVTAQPFNYSATYVLGDVSRVADDSARDDDSSGGSGVAGGGGVSGGENSALGRFISFESLGALKVSKIQRSVYPRLPVAFSMENCICALTYAICAAYVGTNLFVLLYRMDTIYYLRIYHLAVGVVMVISGVVMLAFMWRARDATMLKLKRPHSLPRPTLISAFLLTGGVVMGHAYLFVFNFAFSNCDKLVDATNIDEQWQEAVFSLLMIGYCFLSLIYILQRSYYGSMETCFDMFTRQWVNVVLTIVWIKIVIFKGYHSYQELCQRKEISGYWCPIVKHPYQCKPDTQLHGTQKIWHYLHKGLLSSAIISCASEFFPVMLVGHWLACGRAEERADELIRRREEKKSVRRILQGMMGNVSQVYGVDRLRGGTQMPQLQVGRWVACALNTAAWLTGILVLMRWVVGFYFAINFDRMHESGSMADDSVEFATSCAQLALFIMLFKWSLTVEVKRFDAHHKAESRGDLILIVGSAAFMSVKLLLQIFELNFQRADGFLRADECIIRVLSLSIINASEWFQFLCLRRVMALHCEDVHATRTFLPSVTLSAIVVNWVGFGMTFFETNTIKYQLSKPDFHFSQPTLISMIFTQTIYPADYLFMFTAAGCWTDVLLRYFEMGFFQLGKPMFFDEYNECGDEISTMSSSPANRHHATALRYSRRKTSSIDALGGCRKTSTGMSPSRSRLSLYLRPNDVKPIYVPVTAMAASPGNTTTRQNVIAHAGDGEHALCCCCCYCQRTCHTHCHCTSNQKCGNVATEQCSTVEENDIGTSSQHASQTCGYPKSTRVGGTFCACERCINSTRSRRKSSSPIRMILPILSV